MPSPKNNRKGANNTNLNVGTLYNLPPNAPRRRSLLGRIGGLARSVGGAAVGAAAYLGRQSAQRGFNVQIDGKNKQPVKPPPTTKSRLIGLVAQNEAIAAQRRNKWNGANESERPVSFAGALTAVAGAGAIHGVSAAKRAHNLGQAAKTGFYSAKTLRHAARR
jgi:hypothetical protein